MLNRAPCRNTGTFMIELPEVLPLELDRTVADC
jgi:hypothetical protein